MIYSVAMKRLPEKTQGVTLKSLLVASILIPINCYWVIEMEVIRYSGHPVTISLFFNVIFSLFVIVGLNRIFRQFSPTLPLTSSELIVVYLMLSIASGIAGHDMLEILVPMLGHAFRFATSENEWRDLFTPFLPDWLTINDNKLFQGYYQGEANLYTGYHLQRWAKPVLWWTLFVFMLGFGMFCLNVMIRKRWIEHEKLSYPIIQLPMEMSGTQSRDFYRSRFMWIGFALSGGLAVLNGLNFIFPVVPELRTRIQSIQIFTETPWNAMGRVPFSLYPFAIGLGFFIPLDLSFSCWFFFWFWRLMRVAGAALGLRALPRFPYMREQASGGYIALCVIAIWASREHLLRMFHATFSGNDRSDDADEPISYRFAIVGFGLVMVFMVFFCLKGGGTATITFVFFAFYYAISIAITRMRAELGTPVHDLHYSGPDEILTRAFGTRRLGRGNLIMFSMFWFINRAYRSHQMPHQLEGFKIAERFKMDTRRLILAIMLATLLGSMAGFWSLIDRGYRLGMEARAFWPSLSAFGLEPYRRLSQWLGVPTDPLVAETSFMGLGFVLTLLLMMFRMKFVWWPFHPAGFAISTSWGMNVTWSCLFMSWVIKWAVLKHGGIGLHRKLQPFFLGLILGEFICGSLWTIIGIIAGIPTYGFWV